MSAEEPLNEEIQDELSPSRIMNESHDEMKTFNSSNLDVNKTSLEGGAKKEPWAFSFEFTHEPSSIYNQISTYVSMDLPYLEFIRPMKTSDLNEGGIKITGIYDDLVTTQYGLMMKTSDVPVILPSYEPNVQIQQTYEIKQKRIKPSKEETKTNSQSQTSNEEYETSSESNQDENLEKDKVKSKSAENKTQVKTKSEPKDKSKAKSKLHDEAQQLGGKTKPLPTVVSQAPLYLSRMHGWRNTYTSKYSPAEIYKYVNAMTLGEEIGDFFEELGYFSTGNFILI